MTKGKENLTEILIFEVGLIRQDQSIGSL